MSTYVIREINDGELDTCVEIIQKSFETVAVEFGLTRENCPTNGAFIEKERLASDKLRGNHMFGLSVNDTQVGFVQLAKQDEAVFSMEKLAVLPRYRHTGLGKALMDFSREYVKSNKGEKISIGIINENEILKQWYSVYGFVEVGTRVFSHLPFTVCFMELHV